MADPRISRRIWHALALAGLFLAGGACTVAFLGLRAMTRHDLSPWHELRLTQAQNACVADSIRSLDDYRACEARLLAESDARLAGAVERWPVLSRFDPDSRTSARSFEPDWNSTVELAVARPAGGALLLHGLSDSPYSLHAVARLLHARGYHVIAPRLPGHGLFPGALVDARWQHWRRITALAARDLRGKIGEAAPLLVVGYSNGAALALDLTLQAIEGNPEVTVKPDRLVFLSPAFAVTQFAGLGGFVDWLSRAPGLGSLAWNSVVPEFDPVKYNSFPVRAGYEIHGLLQSMEAALARLADAGRLGELPPLLTIQSVADDTVPPVESLTRLYSRVHDQRSQLVLFDVNRESFVNDFLAPDSGRLLALVDPQRTFNFEATLVTNIANAGGMGPEIQAVTRYPGTTRVSREPLGMRWPGNFYSLSHVAIPFAPDDPVYGTVGSGGLGIGSLAVKGERGALSIPPALLIRLRYNPFHAYLERRLLEFIEG